MIRSIFVLAFLALGIGAASAQQELPAGHQPVSEEALRRALGEGPRLVEVTPAADLPGGVIDVTILDAAGAPLPNVDVRLGILRRGESAGEKHFRSDAQGKGRFSDIPLDAAVRVTLDHDGARTLTTPIAMQPSAGHRVVMRRLETSRDARMILQRMGRTIVEWKTDRARITQIVELMNFGDRTFVFAEPGLLHRLPEGALAFEAERSMDDQRLEPVDGGFRIRGSVPPGNLRLQWHYDLPMDRLSGQTFEFAQALPFPQTVAYQIVVDAASGMSLSATGFPEARPVEYQGRHLLVTEVERTPQDPPFQELRFKVSGIPGPGYARWVAIGLAILGFLVAFVAYRRVAAPEAEARDRAKALLLDQVDELARLRSEGEIGDDFFSRERERLIEELALLEHAAVR